MNANILGIEYGWTSRGGQGFDMKVEDEDYVTHKPQIQSNEEEKQMENLKVKTILISELQMTNQSLNDKYRGEEAR